MEFNVNNYDENASTGSGSGQSKTLKPGTHFCRIVDIKLYAPSYKPEAYFLNVILESVKPSDDFVGFDIDKNNPEMGKYEGPIATVQNGKFSFSDFVYNDKNITRDEQIFNYINGIASQLGVLETAKAKGIKADTIEEYIDGMKKYLIDPDLWAYFTIAGREYYKGDEKYPRVSLYFPKKSGQTFPYSLNKDDVMAYNETMLEKAVKPEPVEVVDSFDVKAPAKEVSFKPMDSNDKLPF